MHDQAMRHLYIILDTDKQMHREPIFTLKKEYLLCHMVLLQIMGVTQAQVCIRVPVTMLVLWALDYHLLPQPMGATLALIFSPHINHIGKLA